MIFQQDKQDKRILELKNLRVDPQHEKQGIGSSLVSLIEDYARELDYKRIQADAHPENSVVGFMEKRGYRIEAHETLYTAKKEVILVKDV